jgi:uncharacterized BrkB/YihY/UPF0761 family membrane protein
LDIGFSDDEALSWGASIARYTLFSIAPVLELTVCYELSSPVI